ncbi:MAG TPA: TonB-dependent siderophore receptor [Verrucomicrobiales bacterium]|nr:TonB-dependent siderophore receptor [Verrucomicrobiales bacterium]
MARLAFRCTASVFAALISQPFVTWMSVAGESSSTNSAPVRVKEVNVRAKEAVEHGAYRAVETTSALKTATPILQTPVSVQVVPLQVLQDQHAIRMDRAIQNVSGVVPLKLYGNSDSFSIRGFDQLSTTFEDGLRLDNYTISGFTREMSNIERVEVIKGPASVLYGRAEPGGLVNFITKKPLDAPAYSVEQEVGSFSLFRTTFDATGPLNSERTVLYRLIGDFEKGGSFRDFIHPERLFLFPSVEWRPTERDRLTLETKYADGREPGDQGIPFLSTGKPADIPISRNLVEPGSTYAPITEYSTKLIATHEFTDDWKARLSYKSEHRSAPTPSFVGYAGQADAAGDLQRFWMTETFFEHWVHQVSFDVTGHFETPGMAHTVIAGLDYYHHEGHYDYNETGFAYPVPSINIYSPVYGQPFPAIDPTLNGVVESGQDAYGAFFQDQIELPGHVHLLGGFRYDQASTFNTGYGAGVDHVRDTPSPTPRAGVLWRALPTLSFFTTYTENFGSTSLGRQTWTHDLLPPESAQQFEVGVKTEWLEKRLSATASLYQLTKQNVSTTDPLHPAFSIAIGEARSRGVELDLAGAITESWRVIGSYSYIDTTTTKDNNGYAGMRFPGIPYHSASLWTTYDLGARPDTGFRVGAGVVARTGEVDYSAERVPGFGTLNALVAYRWISGKTRFRAQVNVENLLDKTYYVNLTSGSAFPGSPLACTGSLRVEF